MSKSGGVIYETVDQVEGKDVNLFRPYMFPPSKEVAQQLGLDKCIRVLPHHQNTGGFFICVIQKKKVAPTPKATLNPSPPPVVITEVKEEKEEEKKTQTQIQTQEA